MRSISARVLRGAAAIVACVLLATLAPGVAPAASVGTAAAEKPPPEVFTVFRSDPADPQAARQTYLDIMAVRSVDNGYYPTVKPPVGGLATACPPDRCLDRRLRLPKGVKVNSSMVRVLLPVGYDKKKNRHKRYPVVYLYNGALSDYQSWSRKTLITKISRGMKAIFVMPEGAKKPVAGMFTDWYDDSYDWESFHIDVVIPWVDRTFRTLPGARVAAGASMGGLGALIYPARHPGMFKSLLSLSGLADNRTLSANIYPTEVQMAANFDTPDMKRVWGNPVLNQDVWAAHNPAQLAEQLKGVDIYIAAGTGYLTSRKDDPDHTGRMEHLLWQGHRNLFAALTLAGTPFTARIREGGIHNWPYFHTMMLWGLPKAIAAAKR